jgi:hypothetical protein
VAPRYGYVFGFLPNWNVLAQALLERFGPSTYDDLMESLTGLKQITSAKEYKEKFEALSNRVRGIDDHNKFRYFLSRLKDEIQLPVRMFNPQSLLVAYGLAKLQEEHVLTARRFRSSNLNFSSSSSLKCFFFLGRGVGLALNNNL